MIQINPLQRYIDGGARAALTDPPSASLVFDLPGKAIWVKGVKLKGTDHTYTFSHDNYITLTNTPGSNESEDILIGVNITTLKAAIDTTYSVVTASSNGLAPMFSPGNLADTDNTDHYYLGIKGSTLKWYKNAYRQLKVGDNIVLGVTDKDPLQIVSADDNLSVTWNSTNKLLVIKNEKPAIGDLTDINVSQFKVTDNINYRLLFKGTANDDNYTGISKFSEYLLFNPSTKTLTIDGNVVLHSGNYLNYSNEISKILANLKASINSINTKITSLENFETKVLTINGIGYNIYTSNPSLPNILALDSLGTPGLLLSSNGINFTWIDDTIINNNININWNTETTIATIHNIPIKIKIPANPNTWRNIRINNSNLDIISSNDIKPLIISQGTGIEVAYINDKIVITNTSPDVNHNTHYTTTLYVGNNDNTTTNILVLNPYIKLFDDNIRRSTLQLVAGNGIRIQSENNGIITISNNNIDDICKVLAQLKGEIHSFNHEINSQLINADIISATNLYANNILLNNNQVVHTGSINHSLVTLTNWNTEYTIVTIAGIDIKVKTPVNPISILETKVLKINGVNYNIYTTEDILPQLLAPTHLGSNGLILSTNGNVFLWIDCPITNVTTSAILSNSNEGVTHITETIVNPYYNLLEGEVVSRSIRFLAGTGIAISATVNGEITITNTIVDTNTDEKVKLIITTDNSDYRVLLKSSANDNEEIAFSKFTSTLTYNPNSKTLKINEYEVLHAGNYLKYTNEINQILAEIKGNIRDYEQFFDTSVLGVTNAYVLYLNVFESAIFNNTITANGFIKNGGTSNLFLKADGSIDNTQYLPLTGGILSGNLIGFKFTVLGGTSNDFLKGDGSLDNTTYISENTWNNYQENISIILNSIYDSIKNFRNILDTSSFGIDNAYIENLIVSNTVSFVNRPIIGNSEALISTDKMYIGTTQVLLTRTSAPLDLYNVHLISGGTTVSDALLSNGFLSSVWLYWDAINGSSSPWGIMANNNSSTIEFIKAGSTYITLNLSNGFITSKAFIKQGGTSLLFLKADGSVDSTEYLSVSCYNTDLDNLSKVLATLQAGIKAVNSKIQRFDNNTLGINIAYIQEAYVKTLQATEDVYARNFCSTSDIKKKQVIGYLSDDLYDIFNNSDGYLKQFMWRDNNKLSFGLIALEIQEFAPEAVVEDLDGYLHVNYNVALSKIVGALFRKIKEQEQMINELKNRIK